MDKQLLFSSGIIFIFMQAANANPVSLRATITGGGGDGRCTISVSVDHSAEVDVSGDLGLLTTTGGQPATWRRFQCNAPMPRQPVDFRFVRIEGRGSMRLLQDPRSTGGRTVVQITDPQSGRGNYTFDLQWRGPGGGGWQPGPPVPPGPPRPPLPPPGSGAGPGGLPMGRAIQICQDSVTDRLNRDGYQYVAFERTLPDPNPGHDYWISGGVNGKRGFRTERFSFSCSVDARWGRVRSVDVQRRDSRFGAYGDTQ